MLDAYETQSLEYVAQRLILAADALSRAGEHVNEEDMERDCWGYLALQIGKAKRHLELIHTRVIGVRTRLLDRKTKEGV